MASKRNKGKIFMCIVGNNVLIVGVANKARVLKNLAIRVLAMDTSAQAIRCLKEERIDSVISHWELIDMPAGEFLKNVKEAKPSTPTVAFVRPGDVNQEIAARTLGVDAVLDEDVDSDYFRETICQLLGVSTIKSMHIADD
jgi:response regulator RpfG family c-di-GMP phosphodiesterase